MQCTVSLTMSFCSFVKDKFVGGSDEKEEIYFIFYFINRNRKLLHLLDLLNFTYNKFIILLLIETREKSKNRVYSIRNREAY